MEQSQAQHQRTCDMMSSGMHVHTGIHMNPQCLDYTRQDSDDDDGDDHGYSHD